VHPTVNKATAACKSDVKKSGVPLEADH
jgi:hypothetical protein